MPLPSTRVIHPDWEAHHRPTAQGAQTAGVRVNAPGTGDPVWDEQSGTSKTPDGELRYSGTARIQALTLNESEVVVAEQEVTTLAYLVAIDADADTVAAGDIVTVEESSDGSLADNHRLRVAAVARGSLRFERYLTCLDDLG